MIPTSKTAIMATDGEDARVV